MHTNNRLGCSYLVFFLTLSTMAGDPLKLTTKMQQAIGLHVPNMDVPRSGDRTCRSESGPDTVSVIVHMDPLREDYAKACLNSIPEAERSPADLTTAMAIQQLSAQAAESAPDGLRGVLNGKQCSTPAPCTWYHIPGGVYFESKKDMRTFAIFFYRNQDKPRVKWQELTGLEQWEWFKGWEANGKTHARCADATLGLRGTKLKRITNEEQLQKAILCSPSAKKRRPVDHTIGEDVWKRMKTGDESDDEE